MLTENISLSEESMDVHMPIPWYVRLWASVLRRAIVDWILYRDHENVKLKKVGLSAGRWIFSENTSDVGSFDSICSMMGIAPEVIRQKICALTEEEARRLRGMEFGDS